MVKITVKFSLITVKFSFCVCAHTQNGCSLNKNTYACAFTTCTLWVRIQNWAECSFLFAQGVYLGYGLDFGV